MYRFVVFVFLFNSMKVMADTYVPAMTSDNGYVEPFRMFDNVYYVGDKWVSSYAIKTSSGLAIIDTLDFPYCKWIPHNLEKLGLDKEKVTHIFVTHGHSDHVGGAEFLQSLYGAKVIISEKALELSNEQALKSKDKNRFLPPVVESFAEDGAIMLVGDTKFKLYITPGHTEGDLSIDFVVKDEGKLYRAFVVGGHSADFQNSTLAQQFIDSMERIKKLALQGVPVTVNLSNHPHKNNLFENREKSAKAVASNPFISNEQFFQFVEQQTDLAKIAITNNNSKK
ncbi:MBL fold metallo-hydrolase [Catenovulum sp. SX2]|uniref:MBL fold metallo-hydrolase n=1 Tax=Catenovulum sp. SX2 TaxID=3398614 RepID=UPI003F85AE5B